MPVSGWAGVRVVVTGSSGFIGGHLVHELCRLGARVLGVDRRNPEPGAGWEHLALDLAAHDAPARLAPVCREAEVVFHLAARPGVRDADPDATRYRRRDNVTATLAVCGATPLGLPLVVASSSSVYGGARVVAGRVRPSHETDPLRPRGGYARTKVLTERICAARAARGGLVAVARPFTVVGERQRPDMALARWIRALRAGEPVTVLGSLRRGRDLTDVRLVVRALLALAEHLPPGPVNVGTGRVVSLEALLAAVAAELGVVPALRRRPAPAADPPATRAHTGRLARLLGPVPACDLRGVVARCARSIPPPADLHSQRASANMALHSPC